MSIPVLYRDEHLVAVSKPSGLLVHRTPDARDRVFLLQRVRDLVGCHVYPVHRIDRGASGIVLFALDPATAAGAQACLSADETVKEYRVLCRGSPPDAWGCARPLRDDGGHPRVARSEFMVAERFPECALVHARIHTGRRHQIRRHLNHCAFHVVGDTCYGKGGVNREFRRRYGLHRLFLHAARLEIDHPVSASRLEIEAPLTGELAYVLDRLRTERG